MAGCAPILPPTPERVDPLALSAAANPAGLDSFVFVPDSVAVSGAAPALVVVLHPCFEAAEPFAEKSGWMAAAERGGFALLLVQQPLANDLNRCFHWFEASEQGPDGDEVRSILAALDSALAATGADPARVHVTGLSAGGAMAMILGAAAPDRFAGVASFAGVPVGAATSFLAAPVAMAGGGSEDPAVLLSGLAAAAGPQGFGRLPPLTAWHGASDTFIVPANGRRSALQWAAASNAVAGAPQPDGAMTVTAHVDAAGAIRVRHVAVDGLGHAVPVDAAAGCGSNDFGTLGASEDIGLCGPLVQADWWGLIGGG